MKIIFLDVDGVLNSVESMLAFNTFMALDIVKVGLVERLAKESGAKIVVSSSWRTGRIDRTKELLHKHGAARIVPYIIDETELPKLSYRMRGHEIAQWLRDHKEVSHHVILDDDSDMLEDQNFVKTDMANGITLSNYLEALAFLQPDHKDLQEGRGLIAYAKRNSRVSYDEVFKDV